MAGIPVDRTYSPGATLGDVLITNVRWPHADAIPSADSPMRLAFNKRLGRRYLKLPHAAVFGGIAGR